VFWVVLDNGFILSAYTRRVDATRARDKWNWSAAADRTEKRPLCRRWAVGVARSNPSMTFRREEIVRRPKMLDRWAVMNWSAA